MFNRFTGLGGHRFLAKIVLAFYLRGFAQGTPALQLADEWECDYGTFSSTATQCRRPPCWAWIARP